MNRIVNAFPKGTVTVPPSKSVAHRALICSLLAEGKSTVRNLDFSQDIAATWECIQAIGAKCSKEGDLCTVEGGLKFVGNVLNCNESGSTLRFFIPIAAVLGENFLFTGKGRLLSRPLDPYVVALGEHGVQMDLTEEGLKVSGKLSSGTFKLPGNISSQFITGLLFALPLVDGDSEIILDQEPESRNYIALTLQVMQSFGIEIKHENFQKFYIKGNSKYQACDYCVEADYSQAAFFLTASALGCDVECTGLNRDSLQGDKEFLDIIRNCGGEIIYTETGINVKADVLKPTVVDARQIPDLVPITAVLLSFCKGESKIINAGRLRIKESDRLFAIATELNKLGAKVTELEDGLIIQGVDKLKGGQTDAHNDHRIAMALSVAAIKCTEEVSISGAESVNKSYPGFFEDFCKTEEKNG